MADLTDLERRLAAIEVEVRTERLDMHRLAVLQETVLNRVEELVQRVAGLDAVVNSSVRASERRFTDERGQLSEAGEQLSGLGAQISEVKAHLDARIDSLEAKLNSAPQTPDETMTEAKSPEEPPLEETPSEEGQAEETPPSEGTPSEETPTEIASPEETPTEKPKSS